MSSSRAKSLIHVRSVTGPVELRILDADLSEMARGFGEVRKRLRPGLYVLEIHAGPVHKQEIISLGSGEVFEKLDLRTPFPSAAPIEGTSTTHEYHMLAAVDVSRNPSEDYGDGGRLFIFIRNIGEGDEARQAPINVESISLHDTDLSPVGDFPNDLIRADGDGWVGICATVNPGGYALRSAGRGFPDTGEGHAGDGLVDQSVWVSEGWTTMVFVPNWSGSSRPSTEYSSIHMTPCSEGFDPTGQIACDTNRALELALSGLRQGQSVLPKDLRRLLLTEKFANPMLGIIGVHVLLQASKTSWSLFDTVVRNLAKLVPDHPDVTALRLMGKELRGNRSRSRVKPVSWPPMLYASYLGLIARDSEEPGIIPERSPAERAASCLHQEGPWSRWTALSPQFDSEADEVEQAEFAAVERPRMRRRRVLVRAAAERVEDEESVCDVSESEVDDVAEWVQKLASQIHVAEGEAPTFASLDDPGVTRVTNYVRSMVRQASRETKGGIPESFSVAQLSRKVGLPVATVGRAVRTIKRDLVDRS